MFKLIIVGYNGWIFAENAHTDRQTPIVELVWYTLTFMMETSYGLCSIFHLTPITMWCNCRTQTSSSNYFLLFLGVKPLPSVHQLMFCLDKKKEFLVI